MIEQGSGIHRERHRFGGVAQKTIELVVGREAASGACEPKPEVVEDTETNHALQTTSVTLGICGKSSVCDRLLLGV